MISVIQELWWRAGVLDDLDLFSAMVAGWRLARAYWGRGHATEAARAAIAFGFGLNELAERTVCDEEYCRDVRVNSKPETQAKKRP